MRSVMTHQFNRVPSASIPRSKFTRSSGYKTTFDAGKLIPFFVDEVLPGDTFALRANIFARLATPIAPIMDNIFIDFFFFFVPNRLVWNNFQRFMGEQDNPDDSTDYLIPQINITSEASEMSIYDYMGIPTKVTGISVNALPLRAYNLIYNEWFRDENLQDSLTVLRDDGPDPASTYALVNRGKRHDYFTSCLPWPQKGPGVDIPIGGIAPVYARDSSLSGSEYVSGENLSWLNASNGSRFTIPSSQLDNFVMGANSAGETYNTTNSGAVLETPVPPFPGIVPSLYADLDQVESASTSINSLRQAFQIQRMMEKDARGGTRYTELNRVHFGVVSPDSRLQRPEYLGGGSHPVNVNPVVQTSSTDDTSPQGTLAAFGVFSAREGFVKSFVEHGYIIGLMEARADLTYDRGLNKLWSRRTKYDLYWPTLAHLGEQAVLNQEIYAQGTDVDQDVFGYQERFAEYRYKPSLITGLFRNNASQSLNFWHLCEEFESLPVLNEEFIIDNPPLDRVIAVPSEPHFICDMFLDLDCTRPMPVYSVPGLIDHF